MGFLVEWDGNWAGTWEPPEYPLRTLKMQRGTSGELAGNIHTFLNPSAARRGQKERPVSRILIRHYLAIVGSTIKNVTKTVPINLRLKKEGVLKARVKHVFVTFLRVRCLYSKDAPTLA